MFRLTLECCALSALELAASCTNPDCVTLVIVGDRTCEDIGWDDPTGDAPPGDAGIRVGDCNCFSFLARTDGLK